MHTLPTQSLLLAVFAALPLWLGGCDDAAESEPEVDSGADGTEAADLGPVALVADWLNGSLSVLDLDALRAGASTRDEALLKEVDLSAYSPGALQVEVTPDGKTALVTNAAGFLAGFGGIAVGVSNVPADPGSLLVIDIDAGEVVDELQVGEQPMGIAITPDGATAFVANYGSGDMAVVTLADLSVEMIDIGAAPEQVALDDSGEVGMVNTAGNGGLRTFAVSDPAASLSDNVSVTTDSSDIAFFEGTKVALIVSSQRPGAPGGYSIVDATDAGAPDVLATVEWDSPPYTYAATTQPGTDRVLVPQAQGSSIALLPVSFDGSEATEGETIEVGPASILGAIGVTVDAAGQWALTPILSSKLLAVTDLEAGTSTTIEWLPEAGPSYVALRE